jgi:hypothetical protein
MHILFFAENIPARQVTKKRQTASTFEDYLAGLPVPLLEMERGAFSRAPN